MISALESIRFSNISYARSGKKILLGVHGEFRPNRLTAVLGASGCGKTTLLKIVAGRLQCKGRRVMLGHYNMSYKALQQISAFVPQEDVLPNYETVREALQFSQKLRNRESHAEELEELGLKGVEGSLISTLSPGERKRLSVALELVSSPRLIYLDEPISGADSKMAMSIVQHLKKLCASRTVVMAVHQPSSDIFFEFDDILVLKDGRTAYYGPASEIFQFFAHLNLKCPNYSNPADFLFLHALPNCVPEETENAENTVFETNVFVRRDDVSRWVEFRLVGKRFLRKKVREELGGTLFTLSVLLVSLFIGLIFYDLPAIKCGRIRDKNALGLLNFWSLCFVFTASLGSLHSLYDDQRLFLKEYQAGYYDAVPYFLARVLNDAVLNIAVPVFCCILVHFMVGLGYDTVQFVVFVLNTVLGNLLGQSIGVLCSTAIPVLSTALVLLPLVLLSLAVLNGMLVDSSTLFSVFHALQYFSPFKYAFNALLRNHGPGSGIIATWIDNSFFGVGACLLLELLMVLVMLSMALGIFWLKAQKR